MKNIPIARRIEVVGAALGAAREGLKPGEDRKLLSEVQEMLNSRDKDVQTEIARASAVPVHVN